MPIELVQTIKRSEPHKALPVLQDTVDGVMGQAILGGKMFEPYVVK